MFRFTWEPSSGSYNQCLAKITSQVQQFVSVQASVMAAYSDLLCVYGSLCEPKRVGVAVVRLIGF